MVLCAGPQYLLHLTKKERGEERKKEKKVEEKKEVMCRPKSVYALHVCV